MKKIFIFTGLIIVAALSVFLYDKAATQSNYEGLPTVPCLDYTKPVVQDFSLTLKITINGNVYPINPNIGHDFGNCLHDIFVNDSSGKVYVKANDMEGFTLGQFFDVWHETFSQNQIFGYQADSSHTIKVTVNGKTLVTYRDTPLKANEVIEIIYQ